MLPIGKTSTSADQARSNDAQVNGEGAWTVGVQLLQKVDETGPELYVGFGHHELDSLGTGPDFGDVRTIIPGARVMFHHTRL